MCKSHKYIIELERGNLPGKFRAASTRAFTLAGMMIVVVGHNETVFTNYIIQPNRFLPKQTTTWIRS